MRIALSVTTEVLRGWNAFRPASAADRQKALEPHVPGIVLGGQNRLAALNVYRIRDVKGKINRSKVLAIMSDAAAKVSACKELEN